MWNLGWERWADVHLWPIGAKAKEAEGHDLVCATVAGQEWEGWVLATVGDDVVIVLLGELEPWCAQVWKDTVQRVCVSGASRWGDRVRSNGIYKMC